MPSQVTTIVTPATTHDLINLAVLKDDLGITSTTDDAYLGRVISRVSAAIERYCNRTFAAETVKDIWTSACTGNAATLAASNGPMALSRYPVISVTSLYEYTTGLFADVDYILDAPNGLVYRIDASGQQMTWVLGQTQVTYQAGYAVIPDDVQDAVTQLVKARYMARTRDPMIRSETVPGVESVSYAVGGSGDGGGLPSDIADALSGYRVVVTA